MYKEDGTPQGFSLLPRSSIVKTPLRLSNSVGVIDRGYRGQVTAVVDNLKYNYFDIIDSDQKNILTNIVDMLKSGPPRMI